MKRLQPLATAALLFVLGTLILAVTGYHEISYATGLVAIAVALLAQKE